jgi:hypothetical protein
VGLDGKVNVTVILQLTEKEERQFLDALEDLGENVSEMFRQLTRAATFRPRAHLRCHDSKSRKTTLLMVEAEKAKIRRRRL